MSIPIGRVAPTEPELPSLSDAIVLAARYRRELGSHWPIVAPVAGLWLAAEARPAHWDGLAYRAGVAPPNHATQVATIELLRGPS